MSKNDHMLAILWLLASGKKLTAKQLAEKLEVNVRSIYRYIDSLCLSGVPIIADSGHNGGYSLQGNFVKAPLTFDLEEQKALVHAATFAKEAGYPFNDALQRAINKLALYSNPEQANLLDHHSGGLDVISRATSPDVQKRLAELELAVANERSVEIEYQKPQTDHAQKRTIDPYSIIYWNNKWYMVGYCKLREEIRSFRLERIVSITPTQTSFKRPRDFSAREFFLSRLLSETADKDKQAMLPVIIEGRQGALDDLCIHWYLGHFLHERTANHATFLLDEQSIHTYIPYYLLSYGRAIKVVQPQSLKQKLVEITSNLQRHYEN